ncbi:MAG: SDR family NAD(P)-dependent oxidoreductase, partial [Rhodospirillales bacterium]|nr:SDR family NAD(P)-dependent oxidoreductase [Rhodospirillales bacterium]
MAKGPRGVVAITGGERGIGAAIARDLIGRGFTVAVLSIDARWPDPGKLTALQRKRLHAFACDITNETQAAKALA